MLLRNTIKLIGRSHSNQCNRTLSSYRRWQISSYSPHFESLAFFESNVIPPVSGPNDLLIKVNAASINPIDVAMSSGYGRNILRVMRLAQELNEPAKITYDKFPMTLGRDFSGTVVRKGSSVSNYKVGDHVWGVIPPGTSGSHANYVVAKDNHISLKPKNVSDEEAASIPYAGLTAYSALSFFGLLNERNAFNQHVLVMGGSGGVGAVAIQILQAWGARVTTTCTPTAVEWLERDAMVDKAIDYNLFNPSDYVNEFDFILDAAPPKKDRITKENLTMLRSRGTYVTLTSPLLRTFDDNGYIGGLLKTAVLAATDVTKGLVQGKRVTWAYFVPSRVALEKIRQMAEDGKLKANVDKVVKFEDLPESYRNVKAGLAKGKIVVTVN